MGPWWATRGAGVAAWAVAGWPVWRWFAARIGDGSDEPWGLAALAVALVFVPWRRLREPLPAGAAVAVLGAAATVFLGYDLLPALVRGGLWMLALAALVGGDGPALARAGLLLLSLPVVATAQFYLGYPLRAVTAAGSVPVLDLCGYEVVRTGTALRWAGETVLVDAPCSGVQMLWTGLFAACALAAVRGLGSRGTLALWRWAGGAVFGANLLRCVALFLVEVRHGTPPEWLHQGIGLAAFAGALGVVVWRAGRLEKRERRRWEARAASDASVARVAVSDGGGGSFARRLADRWARGRRSAALQDRAANCRRYRCRARFTADWLVPLLGLVLLAVAVRPLLEGARNRGAEAVAFPGWPATFDGRELVPLGSTAREERFAAGFPGKVGAFTDGERTLVLRWVAGETRKLHPALHCLRGLGYAVQPGPIWRDGAGRNWGTTVAQRDGHTRRVRERISDGTGREWTDVSAWWWDAWRGTSAGPWWAVTVFEE